MSSRSIAFRLAALGFLAALHPGCGGSESPAVADTPDGLYIAKITYFRALAEKGKRPEATFRAVMSESWRDRVADGPKEPLAKAAPGKIYLGYIPDSEMYRYIKRLKEFGLNDLKASKPEDYNPEEYNRKALNPAETSFTRVFTVGDEKGSRSYYYRDQQATQQKELVEKFVKCESFVIRACENSVNWSVSTDPIPGRNK